MGKICGPSKDTFFFLGGLGTFKFIFFFLQGCEDKNLDMKSSFRVIFSSSCSILCFDSTCPKLAY